MTLREKIVNEIGRLGPIPFSRYMELCLYDPELGYYSRNVEQFGRAGDFYTSSDVHAVFGRLLARQFEEMWRVLGQPGQMEILELGPGRGLFAQDVLDWAKKKFPQFFAALHYSLLERSPALQERLQATLSDHFAAGKVSLVRELPAACDRPLIVFANEFFDALPFEVLSSEGALRISAEGNRFVEIWAPASATEIDFLDRYSVHPEDGERIEAQLQGQDAISAFARAVVRGFALIIDYGCTRQEQIAGRHHGTLSVYRQHSVSADPYQAPGEQDITAHVNFTALADAADAHGMLVQTLVTQSQFLMGIGEQNQFADAFEDTRLPQERAKVALQLKHLVTPAGMGESFQVLICSKGLKANEAASLSGLNFKGRL